MAKAKTGLDYFPIDVNVFSDLKIRKLIKYQGAASLTVYLFLLSKIYNEAYYIKWDNELPFIISEATGYEEEFIKSTIRTLFEVEILDRKMFDENKVLTSKGIQKRYQQIAENLKRKNFVSEYSLLSSEECADYSEECTLFPGKCADSSEFEPTKEGKGKGKEGKGREETPSKNFVPKEISLTEPRTIEECLSVALRDERWVKANKTNRDELEVFNGMLTRKGTYSEIPIEYKQYFSNWKNAGLLTKEQEKLRPVKTSTVVNMVQTGALQLMKDLEKKKRNAG